MLRTIVTMDLSYSVMTEGLVSHRESGLGDHLVAMVQQSYCFCFTTQLHVEMFGIQEMHRYPLH